MKHQILVRYVSGVVVIVFAGGILLTGDVVRASWLKFFSVAVLVALGGLWLWDNMLWRLPPIQRFPKVPRAIAGTWKGELASSWVDPATKQVIPRKTVFVVIRQSASTAKITLMTDESKSTSSVAVLNKANDDTWTLDHMYLNIPDLGVSHRSSMHHGSGSLAISGNPAQRMTGRYWTDRGSKGELVFGSRSKRIVDDYEAAEALFR